MSNRNSFAFVLVGFLLVACMGAATSYWGGSSKGTAGAVHSGSDDDALVRLKEYTRSIATHEPASAPPAGKLLPDVNTMIEQLAARLQAAPGDVRGWRMLGWSYFHTGRYEQAATAYAKAVELDPGSAEIRLSYEEAKARASKTGSSPPTEVVR